MELLVDLLVLAAVVAGVMVVLPVVAAVIVVRRLLRGRTARRIAAVATRRAPTLRGAAFGAPGVRSEPLGRRWRTLVAAAHTARARFAAAVEAADQGPLRDRLYDAMAEIDAAVADAGRVAEHGSRAERALRDVRRALAAQRRRRRRGTPAPVELAPSLAAAIDAQTSTAQRLGTVVQRDAARLQLIVARLDEVTANALELTAAANTEPLPATSITERVTALRLATAELDRAVTA